LGIRGSALQGSPSHRLPSLDQAWTNWTRGLGGAFRLLPAKRPWQTAASRFVTVVPILALLSWRRISHGARFTLLAGAAIGVLFVAFGLHGREHDADGVALRWMAGPVADVFVRRGTRLVSFQARHERGAFGEPAHLRIEADGAEVIETVIDDGRWHRFDIALKQRAWIGAGGTHRLRIAIDHAWIPAAIIAGSNDRRTLG